MNSIYAHIEYLIRHQDCVIIPGFGAFVAHYQAAHIDADTGIMMPPARLIGFNSTLNHNDGLLAMSISRRCKLSYDNAVASINEQVNSMRYQLNNDKELSIGRLGLLKLNSGNNIEFEQHIHFATSSEFIGLSPIAVSPIDAKEKPEISNISTSIKKDSIQFTIKRDSFRIAASIVAIIGLGFLLSTPVIDNNVDYASLSVATNKVEYAPNTRIIPQISPEDIIISIPSDTDAKITIDTTSIINTPQIATDYSNNANIRLSANDNYYLIVASLATRELAEKYIANSNDNLGLLEKDGKYRIYAATGSSPKQAMEPTQSERFAKKYPGAWVCRR